MDLFAEHHSGTRRHAMGEQAVVLQGFARPHEQALLTAIHDVKARSPFRHMVTKGGFVMSVGLTNCGALGWTSDRNGYRYARIDPETGEPWPVLPACLLDLAQSAAEAAGFPPFLPDACLINRYVPGARMTLHQDKDEQDLAAPIVSVSLGLPAIFLFGGLLRSDKTQRIPLLHGDVAVWGGVDRLRFHGIRPLAAGSHPLFGEQRINLTFRKAG